MAKLIPLYTHPTLEDPAEIAAFLAERGVQFETWPVPPRAQELAAQDALSDADREELIALFGTQLAQKADDEGYRSSDIVAIRPHLEGVDAALAAFDKVHYHDDPEVRAIVGGIGIFGFVDADGRQFTLEMQAGEYISLPAGAWHWFYCTPERNVTAIRLFKDNPSWVAHYRDEAP